MGQCQYRYNPSEQYQRTKPGMGVETICGAPTYPAVDEPELSAFARSDGVFEMRPTGRYIPRGHDDPYCPAHGGTHEPPPPPVTVAELESAYQSYMSLAGRYQGDVPLVIPAVTVKSEPLTISAVAESVTPNQEANK